MFERVSILGAQAHTNVSDVDFDSRKVYQSSTKTSQAVKVHHTRKDAANRSTLVESKVLVELHKLARLLISKWSYSRDTAVGAFYETYHMQLPNAVLRIY